MNLNTRSLYSRFISFNYLTPFTLPFHDGREKNIWLIYIILLFGSTSKGRRKISQLLEPLIISSGHFSDRTFFVTPAATRFSSLLSVIYIDSLIVCLQIALLSFILLLCSGKLPLRRGENPGLCTKKRNGNFPLLFLHIILGSVCPRFHATFLLLPLTLPLERIRYVHTTAEAAVLAAVTVDADVCPPRIILRGIHPHAELTPHAAALDAGRTDLCAVDRAFCFSVKFVFVSQAAVPVPLLVIRSVPGSDPQHAAVHAVQVVMLFRIKLCTVPLRVEELAIHVQTLAAFVIEYLTQTYVRSVIPAPSRSRSLALSLTRPNRKLASVYTSCLFVHLANRPPPA